MFRNRKTIITLLLAVTILTGVFGMAKNTEASAVSEGLGGATAGAIAGGAVGALPGAAIGAVVGGGLGAVSGATGLTGAADGPSFMAQMIGWIVGIIVWVEGGIIALEVSVLMMLISYNDFVIATPVTVGWTLVRDISNLFFVLVLLIIAIGTILRIESYNFKRLLPKVIIMAVLINFSRTICGLIIDFSQVVMMTFVAAFAANGSGDLISILRIHEIINASTSTAAKSGKALTATQVAVAGVFAVAMLAICIVVILVMLVVITMRIVMLWILVVLSPLSYVFSAIPQGQRYAQQWWQEFSKYVIVGPVMAFFLWLAFATASGTQTSTGQNAGTITTDAMGKNFAAQHPQSGVDAALRASVTTQTGTTAPPEEQTFFQAIGQDTNILSFIIAIGMLMGGLMVTQQLGVAGGSFAGAMAGKIRQTGMKGLQLPLAAGAWSARKLKAGSVPGARWMRGIDLNPANIYRTISGSFERKKAEDIRRGSLEAGVRLKRGGFSGAVLGLGATEWGDNYLKGFMFQQGIRRVLYGKAGRAKKFEDLADEREKVAHGMTAENLATAQGDLNLAQENAQSIKLQIETGEVDLKNNEVKAAVEDLIKSLHNAAQELEAGGNGDAADKLRIQATQLEESSANGDKLELGSITDADTKNKLEGVMNGLVLGYEGKAGSIREEISQRTHDGKSYSAEEIDEAKKQAVALRKRAERAAALTPQDSYSRGERRAAFEEKRREFGDTDNEYELMAAFKSAVTRGELTEAGGIAIQATKVGHLNELVNDFKSTREYYFDKEGRITDDNSKKDERYGDKGVAFRQGESFSSDINGFNAFMKDVFVNRLGASEQIAYSLQGDLSDMAQSIHHWTFGQAISTDSDGILRQNSKEVQQRRTYIEMSKRDFEQLSRQGNRLAWMTESWIDDEDHSKGRTAVLNDVGISSILDNWRSIKDNLGRGRFNKNFALNLMSDENKNILTTIGKTLTSAEDRNMWGTFMQKLQEFAGASSKESGSLSSRSKAELVHAEDIREKVVGKRETFVKEKKPIIMQGGTEGFESEFEERERILQRAAASGDAKEISNSINQLDTALEKLNDSVQGLNLSGELKGQLNKISVNMKQYKQNPASLNEAGLKNLFMDIKQILIAISKNDKDQKEENEENKKA